MNNSLREYIAARLSKVEDERPRRQYDGYLEGVWEGQIKELESMLAFLDAPSQETPNDA